MEKKILFAFLLSIFLIGFTSAIDITNCTDLQAMTSGDYVLTNNIDCSDTINWNGGEGFSPIATFSGSLNGAGYNISDFYINRASSNDQAMIANTDGATTIENIGFINVNITASQNTAVMVAYDVGGNLYINNSFVTGTIATNTNGGGFTAYTSGIIENSHSSLNIIGTDILGSSQTGGLVGEMFSGGIIRNSYFDGNITGDFVWAVGGLVGNGEYPIIENSYSTGNINCYEATGGLVGILEIGGIINNSYSTANVNGSLTIGGLVGDSFGTIINSYSTGDVTGEDGVGGLVGYNDGGLIFTSFSTSNIYTGRTNTGGLVGSNDGNVYNSYSTGIVSASERVGGLIGRADGTASTGTIVNSYSTGVVTGDSSVGGLVGYIDTGNPNANVSSSFWDIETSGQATSAEGTGKTTALMQIGSTFTGWDLTDIWGQSNVTLYPCLRFEESCVDFSIEEQTPTTDNLIQGSGTIYESMKSSGAGLGKIFEYLKVALPLLMIGLAIVGIVIIIALSIGHALKGNLLSGRR